MLSLACNHANFMMTASKLSRHLLRFGNFIGHWFLPFVRKCPIARIDVLDEISVFFKADASWRLVHECATMTSTHRGS